MAFGVTGNLLDCPALPFMSSFMRKMYAELLSTDVGFAVYVSSQFSVHVCLAESPRVAIMHVKSQRIVGAE